MGSVISGGTSSFLARFIAPTIHRSLASPFFIIFFRNGQFKLTEKKTPEQMHDAKSISPTMEHDFPCQATKTADSVSRSGWMPNTIHPDFEKIN